MQKIFLLLLVVAICVLHACSKGKGGNTVPPPPVDCDAIDSRFAIRVMPIVQANCATPGCHATGSVNGPGALTNFSQISNASLSIKNAVSSGRMPKGGSLVVQDKNAILCWVNGGAPNN
jgi:hypothetical protein